MLNEADRIGNRREKQVSLDTHVPESTLSRAQIEVTFSNSAATLGGQESMADYLRNGLYDQPQGPGLQPDVDRHRHLPDRPVGLHHLALEAPPPLAPRTSRDSNGVKIFRHRWTQMNTDGNQIRKTQVGGQSRKISAFPSRLSSRLCIFAVASDATAKARYREGKREGMQ